MAARKKAETQKKRVEELDRALRKVDWRELSFVGTEIANIPLILKESWSFPDLAVALRPGGELTADGRTAYLFMVTEPTDVNGDGNIVCVPVVVAFACRVPPPSLIAHDSVQNTEAGVRALNPLGGRPFDMRRMRMAWVPHVPASASVDTSLPRQLRPPVWSLRWESRDAFVRKMKEDAEHFVNYINPCEYCRTCIRKEIDFPPSVH
jgi:hypothetical protein